MVLRLIMGVFAFAIFANRPLSADIWISGHGDIGVGLDGNSLHMHLHFEDNATGVGGTIDAGEYESTDHVIGVAGPSSVRAADPKWSFIGAATDNVWFLPQSIDPAKPYVGFGLEELSVGDWNGNLTWTLNAVISSPAGSNFSLWNNNAFGDPMVRFATTDGISSADQFTQAPEGHEHFNIAFTREGTYQIELGISGTHNTLGLLSDSAVYTFQVGTISAVPEPTSVLLVSSICGIAATLRIRKGWKKSRKKSLAGSF